MEKKLVLHFPTTLVDRPIMSTVVRTYDLEFNILKAYVTPEEEGNLVLQLIGTDENLHKAVKHLKDLGVEVQSLGKEIEMVRDRCTSCTACVPLCPVQSLYVDPATSEVRFDLEKCIACGICIKCCPTRAMVMRI